MFLINKNIKKIVITGGPCAGKSTAMSKLEEELTKRGYKVLVVAESATELITGGIVCGENNLNNIDFQTAILKTQIRKENIFEEFANKMPQEKVVIICDRGCLDNKAYCNQEDFEFILNKIGIKETILRDEYDAIFHLKTAADGAEQFYTLENNSARTETPELARELDKKIISAWTGHPCLKIIDNSTDFNTKIMKLMIEIFKFLGEPLPTEIERKFLIHIPNIKTLTNKFNAKKIDIIQTYLKSDKDNEEKRIRQRGNNGEYVYFLTKKTTISDLSRIEVEKRITFKEYATLLMSADTNLRQIRKERYCFVYDNLYFKLDVFPFWDNHAILEIELSDENQPFDIPNFIEVIKEVTNDKRFKNYELAKEQNPNNDILSSNDLGTTEGYVFDKSGLESLQKRAVEDLKETRLKLNHNK